MTTLAIHNARIIDPELILDGIVDIVLVDGHIARVGPNEAEMVIAVSYTHLTLPTTPYV